MIGDMNKDRLAHAKKVGFEPIDLNAHDRLGELVAAVIGEPVVDSFIDAVGFEAKGHGGAEQPAVETFGGQGENYLDLPKAGELRDQISSQFTVLRYRERHVGPRILDPYP